MKILIFNWRDITNPLAGGAEVYIHEIGKRLAKKHDVTMFCGAYPGCKTTSHIDGIKIIRKGGAYSIYLYAPLVYLSRLRNKFDIIIDCENGIPFFTPLFSRKPKICVMHHVHKNIFSKEMPLYLAWVGYFLEVFLMPFVYRDDKFVVVSPSTQEGIMKLGIRQENIQIVYNGINGTFVPDFTKKKEKLIVYLGRIKKYKQLDHLVKAFSIVKNQMPEAKLAIAGKGDFREIKELSGKLNLKLDIFEDISENEKVDLLLRASVFVTPSMKEGWGLTVIEANKCGTPVIAYDVAGLRDSIRNNETGFLVEPGNIEGLAGAVIKVIKDNGLLEKLSKNALEWSKNFNWDKSAKHFEEMIDI